VFLVERRFIHHVIFELLLELTDLAKQVGKAGLEFAPCCRVVLCPRVSGSSDPIHSDGLGRRREVSVARQAG
jgi:hypothetical protein